MIDPRVHMYIVQYIYNLWVNGGMKKINIKFRCNKYWYHPNTIQLLKCSKLKVFNSTKTNKKTEKTLHNLAANLT